MIWDGLAFDEREAPATVAVPIVYALIAVPGGSARAAINSSGMAGGDALFACCWDFAGAALLLDVRLSFAAVVEVMPPLEPSEDEAKDILLEEVN